MEASTHMRLRPGRRMNVAVLCSHRAPGLVQLLNRDARRGIDYEIVCCVSSAETFAEEVRVERRGVPCLPHPIRDFCRGRGADLHDMQARAAYDALTLELLAPFNPDLLLLVGYRLLLSRVMLEAFDGRIVNLHHGDLTKRRADGRPRFVGLAAVRDALAAGEPETRATAHVVTDRLHDGPVLLRSWGFPAPALAGWAREQSPADVLQAAARAQEQWMLREAWAPMLTRTLELAALALETPGAPLRPGKVGSWALRPDGTLTPDASAVDQRVPARC
jgi:folate-dependent phosphoribosylglycinamide formyltransferase PurN